MVQALAMVLAPAVMTVMGAGSTRDSGARRGLGKRVRVSQGCRESEP